MSATKCSCGRGVKVSRVWNPETCGFRGICVKCRHERLIVLARQIRDNLSLEGKHRGWRGLSEFLDVAQLPTKLTSKKMSRIFDVTVVDGKITFKIERHHAKRWGAVQTWTIDADTAEVNVEEEALRPRFVSGVDMTGIHKIPDSLVVGWDGECRALVAVSDEAARAALEVIADEFGGDPTKLSSDEIAYLGLQTVDVDSDEIAAAEPPPLGWTPVSEWVRTAPHANEGAS